MSKIAVVDRSRIAVSGRAGIVVYATIDPAEFVRIASHYWRLGRDGYARRKATRIEREAGAPGRIAMHREIMGMHTSKGRCGVGEVDHINRDRLDNRRANLRVVDRGINSMNRAGGGKYSRYIGVSYFKLAELWRAYINVAGKRLELGYFKTESGAVLARDAAAISHYGHNATLNLPQVSKT